MTSTHMPISDRLDLYLGDCLSVLAAMAADSVDAIVTDPPYGLGFMGKEWDKPGHAARHNKSDEQFAGSAYSRSRAESGGASYGGKHADAMREWQQWCETWAAEALRVLKPGAHLLAFGGTRTSHRLACAIEDAGFEIRDSIAWLYGSGFPKSMDVSKAIDKAAGATGTQGPMKRGGERLLNQTVDGARDGRGTWGDEVGRNAYTTVPATDDATTWQGWGTALKPAHEPIVVARKPLIGTVAANVLTHGTGALNIDACRIGTEARVNPSAGNKPGGASLQMSVVGMPVGVDGRDALGRWPANVVLDESQAAALDEQSGDRKVKASAPSNTGQNGIYGHYERVENQPHDDTGGASRFFYVAKAPTKERPKIDGQPGHPTVKPLTLMRHLVRLVTPPGGVVLDPFLGSGTTAEACAAEGFACIGIERDAHYLMLSLARLGLLSEAAHTP